MSELLRGLTSENLRSNPDFYRIEPDYTIVKEYAQSLSSTVYGQERACEEVARAMTRVFAGVSNPNRPEFVGMFLGQPGVGKTEMGKAVARVLSREWEQRLKIIDCAEFQERHDVAKLVGSPPGYVGYGDKPLLCPEFLERENVIVFDEIEKADVALFRLLLQIMERGKLEVAIGEGNYKNVQRLELSFGNSIILMTSNIGSGRLRSMAEGREQLGFIRQSGGASVEDLRRAGMEELKRFWKFMPEFPDRLDSVVVFDGLKRESYLRIFDKFIGEYNQYQTRGEVFLATTEELKNWVVDKVGLASGGRALRRQVENLIVTPMAEVKLSIQSGSMLVADVEDNKVIFWTAKVKETALVPVETTLFDQVGEVKVYQVPEK